MVLAGSRHLFKNCSLLLRHNLVTKTHKASNGARCRLPGGHRVTYLAIFSRSFASTKQESYFSAIGGDSDEPPPDLTPEQVLQMISVRGELSLIQSGSFFLKVTTILRTNEIVITECMGPVQKIECNQLASNHPIEDRVRVSTVQLSDSTSKSMMCGVFDGHGGGSCADVISRRLFHYIAVSLSANPKEYIKSKMEDSIVDLVNIPDPQKNKTPFYDDRAFLALRQVVADSEIDLLERFANKISDDPKESVAEKLRDAFLQCDNDLAEEIERYLSPGTPNLLLHFYYSLAVSGCCATVLLLHENKAYVANSGKQAIHGQ